MTYTIHYDYIDVRGVYCHRDETFATEEEANGYIEQLFKFIDIEVKYIAKSTYEIVYED